MASIDFPNSPAVNDIFTAGNSSYRWTGVAWVSNNLGSIEWDDVTNKPATFTPSAHTHPISEVTNLQTSLGDKKDEVTYEISTNTNLVAGGRYMADTSTALTLTLPATPAVGDEIQIFDKTSTAETNNITVNNNGLKINGVVDTLVIDVNGAVAGLVYTGTNLGWRV